MGLVVIRYGEIGLKGKNQPFFIKRLRRNLRDCLKKHGLSGEVRSVGKRIYVYTDQVEEATEKLRDVFGVVSLSPAREVQPDIEAIKEEALRMARQAGLNPETSFHIAARRSYKGFPLTSPEINREVGAAVQEATGARVDLSEAADVVIGIEVHRDHVLVFGQTVPGWGGLPLGTQGRAVALISGGIDSPVAAWLIMKRGCGIIPVHFRQSEVEAAKALDNCHQVLGRYAYGWQIEPIVLDHAEVFGPTYEKLLRIGEERWTCLFCKRTLLKKAQEIAYQHRASALVTGDSLGQVASQTLENLRIVSHGLELPVLRPLIGMDKIEVMALARRIGTYEVSTREAQGCPFMPTNPLTRASMDKFREIMARLEAL